MKHILLIISIFLFPGLSAQELIFDTGTGLECRYYRDTAGELYETEGETPLFSLVIDDTLFFSDEGVANREDDSLYLFITQNIHARILPLENADKGYQREIIIYNYTTDTVTIENMVPFGQLPDRVHITGMGPWSLARAYLFLPGQSPVGVILPDNAWELGYGTVHLDDSLRLCGLARRKDLEAGRKHRYKTDIYPGGSVSYHIYVEEFSGDWQNGIKKMFQEKWLFDLETFDNSMFERKDLQWIRNQYIIALQFAWDKEFYDAKSDTYKYYDFLERGEELFGGYDVYGLWPTWPRLGLDQRNQWDLFADLPGGLEKLREFSERSKELGTKFFLCYNPWDQSTREENPYKAMSRLIEATDADGVVLDTRGASSYELQRAADLVKPGVVMYSEGMAVVKDMPGIVAGRVHDAIKMPPPLNLNKLIKPDFAIFRVSQLMDGRIHRDAAIAFFNGYGTEINSFAPGRPDWIREDLEYLGRTTMILRENSSVFLTKNWTPLISSTEDSIWVNEWSDGEKTLYTVLGMRPEGYQGPLFAVHRDDDRHYVSLWHHTELTPSNLKEPNNNFQIPNSEERDPFQNSKFNTQLSLLPCSLDAFNASLLGTRAEGSIDCIAAFPKLLEVQQALNHVNINAPKGDMVRIWAGNPSYQNNHIHELDEINFNADLWKLFGNYQGKFVVQLLEGGELLDERVLFIQPGIPVLVSEPTIIKAYERAPKGMKKIEGGRYTFHSYNNDRFIPYPAADDTTLVKVATFYMDEYPVTNLEYKEFIKASGYVPEDTSNYLRHWGGNTFPDSLADHPVVYVSPEDAEAYAGWAGKRLPTEMEWQYAAQGSDGRKWPWGGDLDEKFCNSSSGQTTPVDDHKKGRSPFGIFDMVGNVWQMTADVYDNGSYRFRILKGGSFYNPTSSWWYVKGGPQPVDWQQMLLLVGPGMNRNATVGFRCVADYKE